MEARDIYRSESERKARAIVDEVTRRRLLTVHVEQDEEGAVRVVSHAQSGAAQERCATGDQDLRERASSATSLLDRVATMIGAESHAEIPRRLESVLGHLRDLEEGQSSVADRVGVCIPPLPASGPWDPRTRARSITEAVLYEVERLSAERDRWADDLERLRRSLREALG